MNLKGKKVAIVGLARSGMAAAKLCVKNGAKVIASDAASTRSMEKRLAGAKEMFEEMETGKNTAEFLLQADLVVVSPGVPLAIEALGEVKAKGVEIVAEVELASWFVNCPIVGITGSNGKTTTTLLLDRMLRMSNLKVFTGGNVGTALSELPLSGQEADVAVVELSSFQLEAIRSFKTEAAAILNITVDHMDRYKNFEDYAQAKMTLMESLSENGVAVVNAVDYEAATRCGKLDVDILWFGDKEKSGAYISGNDMVLNDHRGNARYSFSEFALVGEHNRQNAMAAALLAGITGGTDKGIQKALDTFEPILHRIEPLGEINGVAIFNDSKATAPESVVTALKSFDAHIVLLLGGKDKGADFSVLNRQISKKAKEVFTFGMAGRQIVRRISGSVPVSYAGAMKEAFEKGLAACEKGDVLLLSPGCASFDEFENFEHRGRTFKEWVVELQS